MHLRSSALAAICLSLVACGNEGSAGQPGTAAGESQLALGLTERQLLDADLMDASGNELGDVEGIVRDTGGAITHLLVEIEDSSPDRYVHVPLQGLQAFQNGNDQDVRTSMTREQLMALPEVRR